MQISNKKNERVIVYVDGFNLYFGIRDAGLNNCRWLNIKKLVNTLLRTNQTLISIKYFTSRVSNNPEKQKRQSTYIDALESTGIKVYYGKYQDASGQCNKCGHIWKTAKEKMTDVNIATTMLIDSFNDAFDTAMLISGDSDLVPPIKAVHLNFSEKRVLVAFPPQRHNSSMATVAKGSFTLGRKTLMDSQFDQVVKSKIGYLLKIPVSWK